MSRLIFILSIWLPAAVANAQGNAAAANGTSMVTKLEDVSGSLYFDVNAKSTKGTPFLLDKTANGMLAVQKKEETKYNGFECRFDLLNNSIQVLFAGNWYVLKDRLNEAKLYYMQGNDTVKFTLRSNYPAAAGNDSLTIYEVVEDGPAFQLLRYLRKTKADISIQGSAYQYEYRQTESWYLYNAAMKKMAAIQKNVLTINIVPDKQLEAYQANHKMPRKTSDWKKMVQWLNTSM